MKNLRPAAAAVIVAVAAVLIWHFTIAPWRCNLGVSRITAATERVMQIADTWRAGSLARANLAALERCTNICRDDIDGEMLAAANLRVLGRNEDAARVYEHALQWDRRPELYLQLGVTQLAIGQHENAMMTLRKAVSFNPRVVNLVDDANARAAMYGQIAEDQAHYSNLLRNGDFRINARQGANVFNGAGLGPHAPVANWYLYNRSAGTTSCDVMKSTRPDYYGPMLHIRATQPYSGIEQIWQTPDGGPAAVETTAWVYVNRGRACIGSGKFEAVDADAVSAKTGQWEQLRSRSTRCPVAQTVVSACEANSDFYITDIRAKAIAGAPPCGEMPDTLMP